MNTQARFYPEGYTPEEIKSEFLARRMMDDTITNPNYYSNSASSPYGGNDASKSGRHFAGLYYPKT